MRRNELASGAGGASAHTESGASTATFARFDVGFKIGFGRFGRRDVCAKTSRQSLLFLFAFFVRRLIHFKEGQSGLQFR